MRIFFMSMLFFSACNSVQKNSVGSEPILKETRSIQNEEVLKMPFYAIGPVGIINGSEISAFEYNTELKKIGLEECSRTFGGYFKSMTLSNFFTKKIVDIDTKGTLDRVTLSEVDREFANFAAILQESGNSVTDFFTATGTTESQMREQLRKEIAMKSAFPNIFAVRVEDKTVATEYLKHPKRYTLLGEIRGNSFLVEVPMGASSTELEKATETVKKLYWIITEKGTASSIERKIASLSSTTGFDISIDALDESWLETYLQSHDDLKVGVLVSSPEAIQGFQITSVEFYGQDSLIPFEKVKGKIRKRLEEKQQADAMVKYISKRKTELGVRIFEDNIVDNPNCENAE